MVVEIRILSGSRQGERIVLDVEQFHVGTHHDCEVCFDPQLDPNVRGQSAMLLFTEDGWIVKCTGEGEMWVNQSPVLKQSRIRSGDLLRISDRGPDLSFAILGREASRPTSPSPSVAVTEPPSCPPVVAVEKEKPSGAARPQNMRTVEAVRVCGHRLPWLVGVLFVAVLVTVGLTWLLMRGEPAEESILQLQEISGKTISEGSEFCLDVPVSRNRDFPGKIIFSLAGSSPPGIQLETNRGRLTWMPTESQGPARYPVTVKIQTDGKDSVSDERTFWIEVKEVNAAPKLQSVEAQRVAAGEDVLFSLRATDPDLPPNKLKFDLLEAPAWVSIDSAGGRVRCKPGEDEHGDYTIQVRVTDDGQPPLSDEMVVKVTVMGDPWRQVEHKLQEAVFLTQVELGNTSKARSWPFATCVAIDEFALLTSGREAWQLARWRDEGYKIWAVNPITGLKMEIKEVLVHRKFQAKADQPGEWIYANLGLLICEEPLPVVAKRAALKELEVLEEGLPLACVGFSHGGEKITRFDSFRAQLNRGKLFLTSTGSDGGQLLELKMPMPVNAYGSPVVNQQGKIVGIYGETALDETGMKNLQYATALDPRLIDSSVKWRDSENWIKPAATEAVP